ncbi:amino acid ABC transporter permease [Agromyces atrinae]|uniref:Amino acid ABC transporter permease n=1 Tax=Agromyces atrinae TaxID=592376 RepID=A0A4Q2M5B0_9MICO|nr:amino acid ABC transporter permease [Agromyces atrinae]MCI2958347.1 amino acid ABC transporter permease [Agromyces atrinae]NYD66439.1 glutamate transport system permease protein [Agromyces atrinae]RXZ87119.1 amino acid ABC transporter permease [Agromyces atrinae]
MDVVIDNLPRYLSGFQLTLLLLVVSGLAALVIGTLIAAMRISPVASLRGFATVYTEIVRNTPLTLVLIFCAFILPYLGSDLPYLIAAMIGLAVYTSPFVAEALRSGINGVAVGQAEAARSIGLGFAQTVGFIVFPQAFRMTVPPLINVFIALTKNTSVAGGFFVAELFTVGKELANANGNAVIAVLLGVATFYLVITVPLGLLAARLERKWVVQR